MVTKSKIRISATKERSNYSGLENVFEIQVGQEKS